MDGKKNLATGTLTFKIFSQLYQKLYGVQSLYFIGTLVGMHMCNIIVCHLGVTFNLDSA